MSVGTVDLIRGIEAWFKAECDGDWEHNYGVSIETIDNPGWLVQIDLQDTGWEDLSIPFSRAARSDIDWVQWEVRAGSFIGSGGIANLSEILQLFLGLVSAAPRNQREA